jgi:hypothetical protein
MSGGDGRTEPGFVFPIDAPKCCQHHVRRRRRKKHEMKIKHCIPHVASCLLAARKEELFHRLPAGRNNKLVQYTKIQIKVRCRLTNEQTNTKTQSKTKNHERGRFARACPLSTVSKEKCLFGFGSSSLLLRFPYSPCCVARPGLKETVLPVVDSATL